MRRLALLLMLVSMLALVGPALAQTDQTGVIQGVVLSEAGNPVEGAVVVSARADGSFLRSAVTDPDGGFRIGFLKPGRYDLAVTATGFGRQQVEGVAVSATQVAKIRVELQVGDSGLVEQVRVVAAPALIDTSTSAFESQLASTDIEILPISRDATDLIAFTPGATETNVWGGLFDQANAYQLDGVSVNQPGFGGDFLLPNVDWIEEFQVKGLGAGAEYGSFQGGLVNIVTRSGSNTFEGSLGLNYESSDLNSSNIDEVALEEGEELDSRAEVNASVSGPFVKDKLYYFFSAQQVRRDTRIVAGQASRAAGNLEFWDTEEERTETKLFGKLTWEATDSDIFNLVLGRDEVETDNRGIAAFIEPAAAERQDSPATFWNVSWQRTWNGSNFTEFKLTGYSGDDDRLPQNGDLPPVRIIGGNRDLFRNAIFTRLRSPESLAASINWDLFLTTGNIQHRFKIGGEWEEGEWVERRFRNGGFTWRPFVADPDTLAGFDPNDVDTWDFPSSDWGGDIMLDAETLNAALYVQDYITLTPRLSVNAGIRWGKWEGERTPGFDIDGNPLGGGLFEALSDDAIDPRIGLTYDFTGEGSWVGKIHWGRYHQSMFALMFDRALDVRNGAPVFSTPFQNIEFWDWQGPPFNPDINRNYTEAERGDPDNPQPTDLFVLFDIDPVAEEVGPVEDYEQPYVDQLVVGVERAFNDRWKAGLTYVNRQNEKILALVDRRLDQNYTPIRNITVCPIFVDCVADPSQTVAFLPTIFISNDDIAFLDQFGVLPPGYSQAEVDAIVAQGFQQDLVLTSENDAERELDQVQLSVERRGQRWTLNSSLVWSKLEGNFDSVSGYANSTGGTGSGGFVRVNEQLNWFGELPGYHEWELKTRLTGDLPLGIRAGLYVLYLSGEKYTPVYEIDNQENDFYDDQGNFVDFDFFFGVNGHDVFLEERGTREYDDQVSFDVHLDRPFRLGRNVSLSLALDVFNVTNQDAVVERELFANETGFDNVVLRVPPRTFRFTTTLRF